MIFIMISNNLKSEQNAGDTGQNLNQEIKNKIALLSNLHNQIIRYVGINTAGIIIWTLSGGGYFWPIWTIVLWGSDLLYQAYKLDLLKNTIKYKDSILDVARKWENKQVEKMVAEHTIDNNGAKDTTAEIVEQTTKDEHSLVKSNVTQKETLWHPERNVYDPVEPNFVPKVNQPDWVDYSTREVIYVKARRRPRRHESDEEK